MGNLLLVILLLQGLLPVLVLSQAPSGTYCATDSASNTYTFVFTSSTFTLASDYTIVTQGSCNMQGSYQMSGATIIITPSTNNCPNSMKQSQTVLYVNSLTYSSTNDVITFSPGIDPSVQAAPANCPSTPPASGTYCGYYSKGYVQMIINSDLTFTMTGAFSDSCLISGTYSFSGTSVQFTVSTGCVGVLTSSGSYSSSAGTLTFSFTDSSGFQTISSTINCAAPTSIAIPSGTYCGGSSVMVITGMTFVLQPLMSAFPQGCSVTGTYFVTSGTTQLGYAVKSSTCSGLYIAAKGGYYAAAVGSYKAGTVTFSAQNSQGSYSDIRLTQSGCSTPAPPVTPVPPPGTPPALPSAGLYCGVSSTGGYLWDGYYLMLVISGSTLGLLVGSSTGEVVYGATYAYSVSSVGTVTVSNSQIQPGSIPTPVTLSSLQYGGTSFVASVQATNNAQTTVTFSVSNCGTIPAGNYFGSNQYASATVTISSDHGFSLVAGGCTATGMWALFGSTVVFWLESTSSCSGVTLKSITYSGNQLSIDATVSGVALSTTLSNTRSESPSSTSPSTGAIVGGVVGGVVLAGVVVGAVVYFKVIRKPSEPAKPSDTYVTEF